ncbi:M15 family metallopeptidase [Mesorhizobium sp. WSM4982]|uniref:M15 family metallopeptidase n=1 Tax=Mesorhizobium sp. WSM4982 TaxID=3038550 RepID=UPI002414FAFD|nr:M15 family metallopeptidase [Mesorhizobium sp. WSM4982]MDG4856430.1 M15 family metallopeptidase [Mesorhizobium sp. WSM4982]
MERKVIDTDLRPVELQPQARPVDTFVQPAQSGWRDIADALGKIDRPLAQFMDARAKKQAEEDIVRGQAAYLNGSAGDLATLIQQGKVPAQYSPAFVRGWQLASGDVMGNNLGARFAADYDAWPGKNSTDPTAYEKFTQDWLSKNVPKDADPMVLRGLLPKLRSSVAGMGAQHIQDVHNHVYNGAVDAGVAGANQDVDEFTKEGLAVPEGTNYPKLFEAIQSRRQQMIDQGVRPEDFDKQMMQAMSAKVLSTRDPGLLKWFDEKVPGKDYTYGDTPDGQKIKGETIDALDVINRRNLSEEREQQTARDKETLRSAKAAAVDILIKDPRAAIPDNILAAGTSVDGDFKVNVEQWRQNLSKGLPSDPSRINHVYNQMRVAASQGGDPMTVFYDAMANAVFANKEDMASGLSFAKALTDSKDNIKAAFEDQSYKRMAQTLDIRTKGVNPLTGDPIVGTSNEGLEALYDFQQKVSDWVMANPQATSVDRAKAISDIGNDILKNLAAPADALDTGEGAQGQQYNRPDNLGFDNPFSRGTGTQQDIPVQGSTPAGKAIVGTINKSLEDAKARAAAGAPDPNEVQDFLGGLTPEQKTQMEGRAKAFGLSLEDFATKMLTKPPAADDKRSDAGDAFKPVSFETTASTATNNAGNEVMTPEIASRLLDESLTDASEPGTTGAANVPAVQGVDPQAQKLIGLILQHEAAGNWNAVFGNAHNKVDLGQYSLNQILAMQVAARARGAKSTAIGGPQFIYKTLRGLKEDMGLSGSEKFTPQLQTEMAMVLLRRRGWDQYKAGGLSKQAFALNLSQEWASLPDPRTGRSYYDGDGLNASSVHPRQVYAALGLTAGGEPVQAASFSPTPATAATSGGGGAGPNDVYGNIPEKDSLGLTNQRSRFLEWNPDPIGNNEANLNAINPTLGQVARLAQKYSGVQFVVGTGKRTEAEQAKAVQWGWSKTMDSDHLGGNAVDLWPIVDGKVKFDPAAQASIVKAMKRAAKELGVELDVGADFKRFKDLPHFALKKAPTTT